MQIYIASMLICLYLLFIGTRFVDLVELFFKPSLCFLVFDNFMSSTVVYFIVLIGVFFMENKDFKECFQCTNWCDDFPFEYDCKECESNSGMCIDCMIPHTINTHS